MTRLRDIRVHPYYREVPIEVEPVLSGAVGQYLEGQVLSHQFHELVLDEDYDSNALHVGATYSCSGVDPDGRRIQTHWLYCTATQPKPRFGITRNWSQTGGVAPLVTDAQNPLIRLEKLTDLTVIRTSPPPWLGVSQVQIGMRGWLVMTSLTAPFAMGILIDDPTLPPTISEGTDNIAISAKCPRTLQSIGFDTLSCVEAGNPALFLERVS
ncbi:hypothetical protein [Aliisedimentitalea sp. MJ-SS2]|uniref:hypothetical protein n=1 Tax=Aliisedimentitalea sp. MJ-SS2 TaxID=3049795 RepID=UPI00292CD3BD|nr:hypothetical protein [Alisedimentitalea sp. MJ-SS2]